MKGLFCFVGGYLIYDSKDPRSDIGKSEGARSWYKRCGSSLLG
jgi:hypothetical protein